MATVAAGDVLRVVCNFEMFDQVMQNVWHCKNVGGAGVSSEATYDAIAAKLEEIYEDIQPEMAGALSFESIKVTNLTQAEEIGEEAWPTFTAGGDGVSDALPTQISAVVRFPTGILGAQGRKFIPGVTEPDQSNGGTISAAVQAALATFVTEVLLGFLVAGVDFEWGTYDITEDRFRSFVSGLINTVLGTQRRRTRGVGA